VKSIIKLVKRKKKVENNLFIERKKRKVGGKEIQL
jgi:hypothetical protein